MTGGIPFIIPAKFHKIKEIFKKLDVTFAFGKMDWTCYNKNYAPVTKTGNDTSVLGIKISLFEYRSIQIHKKFHFGRPIENAANRKSISDWRSFSQVDMMMNISWTAIGRQDVKCAVAEHVLKVEIVACELSIMESIKRLWCAATSVVVSYCNLIGGRVKDASVQSALYILQFCQLIARMIYTRLYRPTEEFHCVTNAIEQWLKEKRILWA